MAASRDKIIAFGWYGGKYSHLNWLLPLLPSTTHYAERSLFLETYQQLVLDEPESAVNQPLKEAFLTLRRQVEYDASR